MSTVDPRDPDLPREARVDALIDGIEIVRSRVECLDDDLRSIEDDHRERVEKLDDIEDRLDRLDGGEIE